MKTLVTGAEGMLAQAILKSGKEAGFKMVSRVHSSLDITSVVQIEHELKETKPDIVINCAGIVKYRDFPDDEYYRVNALAPFQMSKICSQREVKMVQISTDCVFSGDTGLYNEYDVSDANDVYGKSKYLGEVTSDRHLTIRCSFIGLGKRGILAWLMQQKDKVKGYKNCKWNGLTADVLAGEILYLANIDAKGLIHVFGQDTNKYDLLESANKVFKLGLKVEPVYEPVIDRRLRTIRNGYLSKQPHISEQIEGMIKKEVTIA